MTQNERFLKRLNNDTLLNSITNESAKYDTKLKILQCVNERINRKLTQKQVSELFNVSVETIKRFEKLESNNLCLYVNYIEYFN